MFFVIPPRVTSQTVDWLKRTSTQEGCLFPTFTLKATLPFLPRCFVYTCALHLARLRQGTGQTLSVTSRPTPPGVLSDLSPIKLKRRTQQQQQSTKVANQWKSSGSCFCLGTVKTWSRTKVRTRTWYRVRTRSMVSVQGPDQGDQ